MAAFQDELNGGFRVWIIRNGPLKRSKTTEGTFINAEVLPT